MGGRGRGAAARLPATNTGGGGRCAPPHWGLLQLIAFASECQLTAASDGRPGDWRCPQMTSALPILTWGRGWTLFSLLLLERVVGAQGGGGGDVREREG